MLCRRRGERLEAWAGQAGASPVSELRGFARDSARTGPPSPPGIEAILYLDRTGCAWRYLPGDFPPWQTVYGYFAAWRDDGTLARLHDVLRELVRASAGRNAEPTAAVIDSQSVRAADTVPKAHGAGTTPRRSTAASSI